MNVLNASIKWNDVPNLMNSPRLNVLVDSIPERCDLAYEIAINRLFFAEKEGFVSYGSYNFEKGGNQGGYGGRAWDITLTSGDVARVQGPWSSRSSVMNGFFIHSKEVSITTDPLVLERGYTFYAGAISIDMIVDALARFVPEATIIASLFAINIDGSKLIDLEEALTYTPEKCAREQVTEIQYDIVLKDGRWKPSQDPDARLVRALRSSQEKIDAIVSRLII